MKMTKQVRKMVEYANEYLKEFKIKDQADPMFSITTILLIQADCYDGFNYFTEDGKLSGGDNESFDHLEFYIN